MKVNLNCLLLTEINSTFTLIVLLVAILAPNAIYQWLKSKPPSDTPAQTSTSETQLRALCDSLHPGDIAAAQVCYGSYGVDD